MNKVIFKEESGKISIILQETMTYYKQILKVNLSKEKINLYSQSINLTLKTNHKYKIFLIKNKLQKKNT
jgi:hypothetical protein